MKSSGQPGDSSAQFKQTFAFNCLLSVQLLSSAQWYCANSAACLGERW